MYQNSWDRTEFPRKFLVMRVIWTLIFALVVAVLSLPLITLGGCGANAACYSVDKSITGIPTNEYVWLITAPIAGIITWLFYTKNHG